MLERYMLAAFAALSAALIPLATLGITFEDDFKGKLVTLADGRKKLYPDPRHWAFTFWPGMQWPDSYGDGTNWLAGNDECQTYVTPLMGVVGKSPVPDALRYDPFFLKADGMHIRASVLSLAQQKAYQVGGFRRFGSGMLLSRLSFTYGRIRIVAKMPSARGSWPALWLLPASHEWPPEIDIVEAMGWGPHTHQIHSGLHVPKEQTGDFGEWFDTPADVSGGFHEYGLDWTPDRLTMLYDGQVLWQKPTPASMHQKMYLIINLAVGGKWAFNELSIPPVDGDSPERLSKGADLIEGDYPADLVIRSVRITSP